MYRSATLFVIAAPSGAGKTTLVRELVRRNPQLNFSVSYTTRRQRSNEQDGIDYFFVGKKEFFRLRDEGALLESAEVFDNYYGTGRRQVEAHLRAGRTVIVEIDWQGARQLRRSMPECVTIFILPPSRRELARRLRDRRTDSDAVIERRLRDALTDMSHWDEFDYCIINDDLHRAVLEVEAILRGDGTGNHTGSRDLLQQVEKLLARHGVVAVNWWVLVRNRSPSRPTPE